MIVSQSTPQSSTGDWQLSLKEQGLSDSTKTAHYEAGRGSTFFDTKPALLHFYEFDSYFQRVSGSNPDRYTNNVDGESSSAALSYILNHG